MHARTHMCMHTRVYMHTHTYVGGGRERDLRNWNWFKQLWELASPKSAGQTNRLDPGKSSYCSPDSHGSLEVEFFPLWGTSIIFS